MPVLTSSYRSPAFLRGGHMQTIAGALVVRPATPWTARDRLELDDGDFVDVDRIALGRPRLAILSHGLEGSTRSGYVRAAARCLARAGWDVAAWNFRGCSGEPNRLPRSYHSGESGDLRQVVGRLAGGFAEVAVVGFSLGGNIALKYAAEQPPHPAVRAVVAVSAPVDLASSARLLDDVPANRLYRRRFLRTLRAKAAAKARAFAGFPDTAGLREIATFREFDGRFTAPLHGFESADDYWRRASSLPLLAGLTIPALLLNARNDPMLGPESFPAGLAEGHRFLHLEAPAAGGHTAFPGRSLRPWYPQRIAAFLESAAATSGSGHRDRNVV